MVGCVRKGNQLVEVTVSWQYTHSPCSGSGVSVRVVGASDPGKIDSDGNFSFHENRESYYEVIIFVMWLPCDLKEQESTEIRMNMILATIKVAIDENRFKKDFRKQAVALVAEMHRRLVDGDLDVVE